MRALAFVVVVLFGAVGSARAQDASRDRAELDAAAGRLLFEPTPLDETVAPRPERRPASAGPASAAAPAAAPGRRPVRIIYPGPYGR